MDGYSWRWLLICLTAGTAMLAVNGSPVCPAGRYGVNCSQYCHANCGTCNESGVCDTCTEDNVYGSLCDKPCERCKNGVCSKLRCEDGCAEGWFEHTEWLGLQPVYSCERCPAGCTRCQSRTNCTSCISKRWDITCNIRCPNGCKLCDKSTGTCCEQGYHLDSYGKCTRCPHTCLSCKSKDKCTACVGERYGLACAIVNCSSIQHCLECNCDSDACESTHISCHKCESGFTGDKCQDSKQAGQTDVKYSHDRNRNNSDPKVNDYNNKDLEFNHENTTSQKNVTGTPSKNDQGYTVNITYTHIANKDNSTHENDTLKEDSHKHGRSTFKEGLHIERVAESKTGAKEGVEKQLSVDTEETDSSWSDKSTMIVVCISIGAVMVICAAVVAICKCRRNRPDMLNLTQDRPLLYIYTEKSQRTPNIDNTSL